MIAPAAYYSKARASGQRTSRDVPAQLIKPDGSMAIGLALGITARIDAHTGASTTVWDIDGDAAGLDAFLPPDGMVLVSPPVSDARLRALHCWLLRLFYACAAAVVTTNALMVGLGAGSSPGSLNTGVLMPIEAFMAPANDSVMLASSGRESGPSLVPQFVATTLITALGAAAAHMSHSLGLTCYLIAALVNAMVALPNAPSMLYCWRFVPDCAAFYAACRLRPVLMCGSLSTTNRSMFF